MAKERPAGGLPVFDPTPAMTEARAILDEAGARSALAGCLAAWAYVPLGGKRLTEDVDFAVRSDDIDKVVAAARARGHRVEKLKMGGCRVSVGGVPVDFIDGGPHLRELFENAVDFAKPRDVGGMKLPVVRKDSLIAMKLAAGARQDEQDVEWLLGTVHGKKRYGELRSFVVSMIGYGGAVLLDRAARRIGHPGPGIQHRN
jgi:hypothetical protein